MLPWRSGNFLELMKLLIITQKIDEGDDLLGFMHGWIAEFAKHCEQVTAIGLYVGSHHLPENVKVLSLGKEGGVSRLKYLWNFYRHVIRERKNYDAVFVHMNPEYVVLGGILWKLMGKKIGLWYAHGHVPLMLRVAVHGADAIFTSTESGFRLPSQKKHVVGQGIDTERFQLASRVWKKDSPFRLIIVGRVSPVKDLETLLRATSILRKEGRMVTVDIIGGAGLPEQVSYIEKLKTLTNELVISDCVTFRGAVANSAIAPYLRDAHCFVNTSHTGSFDKAVGEAMATGLPVLTSNVAFQEVLGPVFSKTLMFPPGDSIVLGEHLRVLMEKTDSDRNLLGEGLRGRIETSHGLNGFVKKILTEYK